MSAIEAFTTATISALSVSVSLSSAPSVDLKVSTLPSAFSMVPGTCKVYAVASQHEPLGKARKGAADAIARRLLPRPERDQAIRGTQHAPALHEVERLDRLVEAQPADPPLFQRR